MLVLQLKFELWKSNDNVAENLSRFDDVYKKNRLLLMIKHLTQLSLNWKALLAYLKGKTPGCYL